jgi:hypothetical protein
MSNYQNGKVYKIAPINGEEGDIYIGSTTEEYLSQRMTKHRTSYKHWKEGKCPYLTAYGLFDKYGLENCYISLIELCPCHIRDELSAREGFHIRNMVCVNKHVMGRTRSEYKSEKKAEISEAGKVYYLKNKEETAVKQSDYYQENKVKLNIRHKEYCKKNAETIKAYKTQWARDKRAKLKLEKAEKEG